MKKNKKTRDLHFRIEDELYEKVFFYCASNGITISKFVRLLMINFLIKENGELL